MVKRAGAKEQPLILANVFSVDLATFGALPLWVLFRRSLCKFGFSWRFN